MLLPDNNNKCRPAESSALSAHSGNDFSERYSRILSLFPGNPRVSHTSHTRLRLLMGSPLRSTARPFSVSPPISTIFPVLLSLSPFSLFLRGRRNGERSEERSRARDIYGRRGSGAKKISGNMTSVLSLVRPARRVAIAKSDYFI